MLLVAATTSSSSSSSFLCPSLLLRHSKSFFQLFHQNYRKHPLLLRHAPRRRFSISFSLRSKHSRRTMTSSSPSTALKNPNPNPNSRLTKKARQSDPSYVLRHELGQCSRRQDLASALDLFRKSRVKSIPLALDHYNSLLYLCSLSPSSSKQGFNIYEDMLKDGIQPNEATFTSLARLAANDENPEMAFGFVKKMVELGMQIRLRSYGPALLGFCKRLDFDQAREVESHMDGHGIVPEEEEIRALLEVSAKCKKSEDVYRLLHRMRSLVRRVGEETVKALEEWFECDMAEKAGKEEWDEKEVRNGAVKGGGGWHGVGWLGKGKWSFGRSEMSRDGVCTKCGDKLVCIDIDPVETEGFARKLTKLASEQERKTDFAKFQEWLERHGPFDAVVDGANVGMYNQQNNFSIYQLNSIVNGLRQISPSKRLPLVILHTRRVRGGPANNPNHNKILDNLQKAGALYATPVGSNDDWYWLYAAVHFKSLLVTNDEMRDHLFQLLGTNFFPRWKEKHQVRLTLSSGPKFHFPPPYSIVIQESENGSWHVPTTLGDDIEKPRKWFCASRDHNAASSLLNSQLVQVN